MSPLAENLFLSALSLSEADRLDLAEALLSASEPPAPSLTGDEWIDAVRQRSADIDRGDIACVSWDEAKRRARGEAAG
jgi:hypothetical protein